MGIVKRVERIGIAVKRLEEGETLFVTRFGARFEPVTEDPQRSVRAARFRMGNFDYELFEPTSSDTPLGRFLEKKGNALFSLSCRVESAEKSRNLLKEKKIPWFDSPSPGVPFVKHPGRELFIPPQAAFGTWIHLFEA